MFKVSDLLKATRGELIYAGGDTDIRGISTDSRTLRAKEAFLAIRGVNFDGHRFIAEALKKGASCIIGERGQLKKYSKGRQAEALCIEVKNSEKALGDIAGFHRRRFAIPVIAVTGSNGKTTTKEMLAGVLSAKYKVLKNEGTKNNQIGLPLTLLKLDNSYDLCVVELGTNHSGEIAYLSGICRPNIGVITNIGPSHLAHLGDTAGVFREKSGLLKNLCPPAIGVLNADDRFLLKEILKKRKKPFVLGFGIERPADFSAIQVKRSPAGWGFAVKAGRLKYEFTLATCGYYNIYNALAAITIARIFSIGHKDISRRLAGFCFPASRLKIIKCKEFTFIDDTYNANPLSLQQALEALGGMRDFKRRVLVLGDMLELGPGEAGYHYLAGVHAARVTDVLITVGRLSRMAAKGARESGIDPASIFSCRSSAEAREILSKKISLRKSDVVLVKGSRLMRMEEVFNL